MNTLTSLARTKIASPSGRYYQLTRQGVNQFRVNGFGSGIEVSLQYIVVLHNGKPHLVPKATVSPSGVAAFDVLIVRDVDAKYWHGELGLITLKKANSVEVAWMNDRPGFTEDLHHAGEELNGCLGLGMLAVAMSGAELDTLEYRKGKFFLVKM